MAVIPALLAFRPLRTAVRRWALGPGLPAELAGLPLHSPVGLAAGFDKDAHWHRPLAAFGFGSIEVGTLTAEPQPGNPKPRLFRLPLDRALINRFGFNNQGAVAAVPRLQVRDPGYLLGVNIGRNKHVPNEQAVENYCQAFDQVAPWADYLTINVSSPNTPGLRGLQDRDALATLLRALLARRDALAHRQGGRRTPMLLKIAPDLGDEQLDEIADLALELGLDGLIATNTTIDRSGLRTEPTAVAALGAGGLSGAPLRHTSRRVVARLYQRTGGRLPIIGVGGIETADDAWEMIRAGASCVQVYTGFIYAGPGMVRDLVRGLRDRLGPRSVKMVVGEAAALYADAGSDPPHP